MAESRSHHRTSKPKGPRSAACVSLRYDRQYDEALAFYNEVKVEATTNGSVFMVCGWYNGTMGIKHLAKDGRKIAFFSVTDATESDDPFFCLRESQMSTEDVGMNVEIFSCTDQVELELPFAWNVGDTISCYVTVAQEGELTCYTGWIRNRSTGDWQKLGTIKTPRNDDDPILSAMLCYVNDIRRDYASVHEVRRASFTNGWVKNCDGDWVPLLHSFFIRSDFEGEAEDSFDAGTRPGGFYLCTGGKTKPSLPTESDIHCNRFPAYFPGLPH